MAEVFLKMKLTKIGKPLILVCIALCSILIIITNKKLNGTKSVYSFKQVIRNEAPLIQHTSKLSC